MRLLSGLLAFAALLAPPALAADAGWGVGAAAGSAPALSVQYRAAPDQAYHVTSFYTGERAGFTADLQRALPAAWRGDAWRLGLYAGIGVAGEATRDAADSREEYRLRLPLGGQYDLPTAHAATFLEAAATLGPLPRTTLGGAVTGGVRARF